MPIYAYKCSACGFAKDVLQKMSDPVLTLCPQCGQDSFCKQLTAAGFQLKGSGWYATDFKGGSGGTAVPAASTAGAAAASEAGGGSSETSAPKAESAAASGGCGAGCACHP
ncbi:FmdB family zinc ribbon protein [Rhodoferax sp.]|uniref:FmdB family zinc ribbon protein n=1 Tax=Rhodoferax sp. TaxID=50421 RepID=UPI0026162A23|nr:FmdB family zinc ribbon protein [Rhodoferax sp.]MDD2808647.1 zinc ribbon domain-containing protein [Rhodoferax sp.]MDD4945054.1 zinc ribbon domain-containing protein [Rhodoferax sp.]MDD5479448.1 zinc ribbon domain-containing protein [Rhodoferax sp.]